MSWHELAFHDRNNQELQLLGKRAGSMVQSERKFDLVAENSDTPDACYRCPEIPTIIVGLMVWRRNPSKFSKTPKLLTDAFYLRFLTLHLFASFKNRTKPPSARSHGGSRAFQLQLFAFSSCAPSIAEWAELRDSVRSRRRPENGNSNSKSTEDMSTGRYRHDGIFMRINPNVACHIKKCERTYLVPAYSK
jgi:hypothetical protein